MPIVPGHPRIAIDADTLVGKARIAGTRIGVDLITKHSLTSFTHVVLNLDEFIYLR